MYRIFAALGLLISGNLQAQFSFDTLIESRVKKLYVAEISIRINLSDIYLNCLEKSVQIRCSKVKSIGFERIDFYSVQFIGGIPVNCFDTTLQGGYSETVFKDIVDSKKYVFAFDSNEKLLFKVGGFRSSELSCIIELYGKFQPYKYRQSKFIINKKYKIDGLDLQKRTNLIRCDI
jgi:hypothetical protein